MSPNNTFFFFLNRMTLELCVYEMCEVAVTYDESFFSLKDSKKTTYQFVLRHTLDYNKSAFFQHFYTIGQDPIEYLRKNLSQIMIDDNGCVKLCFIENLPFVEKEHS